MMIFAIVYLVSGLISTVLQNSYVALAFLPVLKSIARKNRISLSNWFICYFCNDTWRRDHIDRHSDERVCKHRIRGSGSPAVRHA